MLHTDPTIDRYLDDNGYESLDAWMADSDYVKRDGEWFDENNHRADPVESITAAMQAATEP